MATTGPGVFVLFGAALGLGALATGCSAPTPASPTYEADVRPIFMAHCVRCHGGGGTLNVTYVPSGPDAALLPATESAPTNGFLNQFYDSGDCTPTDAGALPVSCHRGAQSEATDGNLHIYLHSAILMPPPPAPVLDDWELKVVDAWVAVKPPVCSKSPTPDPTICPPDGGQ
jgi:hypothetical protein